MVLHVVFAPIFEAYQVGSRGSATAKNILAWSEAARQFCREIGKKPNGKAIRFYLGDDEKKATADVLRLEALWDDVETRWSDLAGARAASSEFACWDDGTVALGRAIAKGEWSITLDPPKPAHPRQPVVGD